MCTDQLLSVGPKFMKFFIHEMWTDFSTIYCPRPSAIQATDQYWQVLRAWQTSITHVCDSQCSTSLLLQSMLLKYSNPCLWPTESRQKAVFSPTGTVSVVFPPWHLGYFFSGSFQRLQGARRAVWWTKIALGGSFWEGMRSSNVQHEKLWSKIDQIVWYVFITVVDHGVH